MVTINSSYELTPIKPEHIDEIRRWRNSQIDVLRQVKLIGPTEQEEWYGSLHKDNKQILFMVVNDSKLPVAYCGLTNINYIYRHSEISFIADPHIAGRKETYEKLFEFVLGELKDYAFNVLNLNRIWTETYAFRSEHIQILENFGLEHEGIMRSHVYIKGSYHDSLIHGLLRK